MKEYKYPSSNHVCTDDNILIVGKRYDYKEGCYVGECEFLGDESNDEYYVMKFKWTIHPINIECFDEFICSEIKKSFGVYSGMHYILPQYSYHIEKRDNVKK